MSTSVGREDDIVFGPLPEWATHVLQRVYSSGRSEWVACPSEPQLRGATYWNTHRTMCWQHLADVPSYQVLPFEKRLIDLSKL